MTYTPPKVPCPGCGNPKKPSSQLCKPCRGKASRRANNPRWKGGRHQRGDGYVTVLRHDHPRAQRNGTVVEHIIVMEETLRRHLLPGETVHHKNGVRNDNRPENLELWVVHQPYGQRPEDLVAWAKEILERYG